MILTLRRPDQFCSVDQGIYGHLTLRNLATLARERGDRQEESRLWQAILAECPGDAEAQKHIAALANAEAPVTGVEAVPPLPVVPETAGA